MSALSQQRSLPFNDRLVLGLLFSVGPMTGRDLRRATSGSLDLVHCRPTLPDVYAALRRTTDLQLVDSSLEPIDEVRRTRVYAITDPGREALRLSVSTWLCSYLDDPEMHRAGATADRRPTLRHERRARLRMLVDDLVVARLSVSACPESEDVTAALHRQELAHRSELIALTPASRADGKGCPHDL